jgi:hypothetical protein
MDGFYSFSVSLDSINTRKERTKSFASTFWKKISTNSPGSKAVKNYREINWNGL